MGTIPFGNICRCHALILSLRTFGVQRNRAIMPEDSGHSWEPSGNSGENQNVAFGDSGGWDNMRDPTPSGVSVGK
jgi:hypothetical protein